MKKFIDQELSNKLAIRNTKEAIFITLNKNFKLDRGFILIKMILDLELLAGQRPLVKANIINNNLLINLKATLKLKESFLFFQKKPLFWKTEYDFNKGYFQPVLVKNSITIKFNELSKLSVWIKSAYLD